MKLRLKACKRCGGDMVPEESTRFGRSLVCLQCGAEESPSPRAPAPDPPLDKVSFLVEQAQIDASSEFVRRNGTRGPRTFVYKR